jgi:hypothetical protein
MFNKIKNFTNNVKNQGNKVIKKIKDQSNKTKDFFEKGIKIVEKNIQKRDVQLPFSLKLRKLKPGVSLNKF